MKAKNAEHMLKESLKLAGIKTPKMPVNVGIDPYKYVSESAEFDHKGSQLVMEAALMESVFGKIANFFKSDYKDVKYAFFANKTGDVMTVVGNSGKFEVVELIGSKARSNKFANSSELTKFLAVKIAQGFELKKKQLDIKGVMKQIGKGLLAIMGIIAFGFGAYYLVSAYGAAAVTMGLKVPSFLGNIMDKITGADVGMVTKELELPPQIANVVSNVENDALELKQKVAAFQQSYTDHVSQIVNNNAPTGISQLQVGRGGLTPDQLNAQFKNTMDVMGNEIPIKLKPDQDLSARWAELNASSAEFENKVKSIKQFFPDLASKITGGIEDRVNSVINSVNTGSSDISSQVKSVISAKVDPMVVNLQTATAALPVNDVAGATKTVVDKVVDSKWIQSMVSDADRISKMVSREMEISGAK